LGLNPPMPLVGKPFNRSDRVRVRRLNAWWENLRGKKVGDADFVANWDRMGQSLRQRFPGAGHAIVSVGGCSRVS